MNAHDAGSLAVEHLLEEVVVELRRIEARLELIERRVAGHHAHQLVLRQHGRAER